MNKGLNYGNGNEGGGKKSGGFITLKDGESIVVRIITTPDEVCSGWEHVVRVGDKWKTYACLGKSTCPICKLAAEEEASTGEPSKLKASFKFYVVVYDVGESDEDKKIKVWKFTKTTREALIGILEEEGSINNVDIKIRRKGTMFKTVYQLFVKGSAERDFSEVELPNIEAMQVQASIAEIEQAMGISGASASSTMTVVNSMEDDDLPF